jgi:hypothetical protein
MRKVASHTRVPPQGRQEALQKFLKSIHQNEKASRLLRNWNIKIGTSPMELKVTIEHRFMLRSQKIY